MRVYKINIEHRATGTNWASTTILAKNFEAALKKATDKLRKHELIESINLLHEDVK